MGKIIFFGISQHVTALNQFYVRMEQMYTEDPFEMARNSHIQTIIHSMATASDQWDTSCEININWIGNKFISQISDQNEILDKNKLDDIFSMCFRFLFELYLSIKEGLAPEFERIRQFAFDQINHFDQSASSQIEYTIRDMPISIFKSITNSESILSIKNFNELSKSAEKMRNDWEADLSAREARVDKLKNDISRYETAFNFVGLFQGFDDLSIVKHEEKKALIFWLRILGISITLPIFAELILVYCNISKIESIKTGLIVSLFPSISLIGISIYYFKILLMNYKSVKSQLLQIELRKTLCRFIQHYSEYSSELKEKDKFSLEKFENIIFSGIVSDDDKLPSAYDGFEQLGRLIKSARS